MPKLAALVPNATGVQPPYALLLGGTNVLKDLAGAAYGAPLESIEVVERGPNGVSSMDFKVDDPSGITALADGMEVLFWDYANNLPIFRGYVDHWSFTPDFGQGRLIEVGAVGVEVWLDWLKLFTAYTTTGVGGLDGAIIEIGASLGSPLNIASVIAGGHVELLLGPNNSSELLAAGTTVPAGTTFREAIRTLTLATTPDPALWPSSQAVLVHATVDFNLNLYVWNDGNPTGGLFQPSPWTPLMIDDSLGGATHAEGPEFRAEPGDVPHEVYVKGVNAAASGLFGDGTGLRRRQDMIDRPDVTTQALAAQAAVQYLGEQAGIVRGSYSLTDWTPPTTVRAGSRTTILDANLSLSNSSYRIFDITKHFHGNGRQDWQVGFGGVPPSAVRYLRRLTRTAV